ncbi:MAG: stage V sporulation protein AB [Acetatifactor sp.]|nr:stage V sporulation protein AB [Acetatifactor sp.]
MQIFICCVLALAGFSFGLLAAAGVFTVLSAVGLVPRFAGKTHSAKEIWLYEDMVILGTIVGCIFSIFHRFLQIGAWLEERLPSLGWLWEALGQGFLGVSGLFYGMFVGCLALAIAEMLDSIPIFTRRISFRHGLGCAVLAMAVGKICGSLFYFWQELHRVVG